MECWLFNIAFSIGDALSSSKILSCGILLCARGPHFIYKQKKSRKRKNIIVKESRKGKIKKSFFYLKKKRIDLDDPELGSWTGPATRPGLKTILSLVHKVN